MADHSMADFGSVALRPPKDWQAFERNARVLFACVLGDPLAKTNGRAGQRQNGVDIFGFRAESGTAVGVQCKGKASDYGRPISERELRHEIQAALNFVPK